MKQNVTLWQALFLTNFFSKTEPNFFVKLRKNRKTEIYEISRRRKVLILMQKSTKMDIFAQILSFLGEFWTNPLIFKANFLKTEEILIKTEQIFPKLSSKNAKTAIYEISRRFNSLETCQKKPAAILCACTDSGNFSKSVIL